MTGSAWPRGFAHGSEGDVDANSLQFQVDCVGELQLPPQAASQLDHDPRALERAVAGDGKAFAELMAPHLDRAFRLATRVTRDRALAEDAVQEAMVIVHRDLRSFRPGTSVRAFLCGTTLRVASTLARSARRRTARELVTAQPHAFADPESATQARELEAALAEALAALPDRRREAVLLRLDADLSHAEIAAIIGTTEAAVRQLVYEGQKTLRTALASRLEAR